MKKLLLKNAVMLAVVIFCIGSVNCYAATSTGINVNYHSQKEIKDYLKLDIENPIIRINTAFKGCSSLEKISVLPRIYHN